MQHNTIHIRRHDKWETHFCYYQLPSPQPAYFSPFWVSAEAEHEKKKIGKISYSNHMKNFFIQFFLSFFSSLCCWLYFHFYWLSYLYVLPLCIVVMIVYTQNYSDSFDLPFYISLCSPFVITACLLYSHALSLMDGRISKIMKIRRGMKKMLDGLGDWAHFDSQICINEEWSSEEIIGGLWMELIYGNVI